MSAAPVGSQCWFSLDGGLVVEQKLEVSLVVKAQVTRSGLGKDDLLVRRRQRQEQFLPKLGIRKSNFLILRASCFRSIPNRRAAAVQRSFEGASKITSGSAGPLSQAFAAISSSS